MSFTPEPSVKHNQIERLLGALAGVVSARVVLDETGRLTEIHILSSHELHPKQIVRNVESALSAGFGLLIDRRIISVAQLRADATSFPAKPFELESPEETPRRTRSVLVAFDTSATAPFDASCSVTVQSDRQTLTGSGTGANTPQGRAEAAARALFDALALADDQLRVGLEGATLIEANGRTYVLIAAHGVRGRHASLLTGVAAVTRSPEEAAILAGLQATNRWAVLPG
jgi:hypothetical protein